MEKYARLFDTLLERVADYFKTTVELVKLRAVEKISELAAELMPNAFVIGILISALFFLNVGLALWLGVILGTMYLGFLAVGTFHFLVVIILRLFFYKRLKKAFSNKIIKALLK